MKTIGLLGGMSWESTVGYYRAMNEGVKQLLGGCIPPRSCATVDFEPKEGCSVEAIGKVPPRFLLKPP